MRKVLLIFQFIVNQHFLLHDLFFSMLAIKQKGMASAFQGVGKLLQPLLDPVSDSSTFYQQSLTGENSKGTDILKNQTSLCQKLHFAEECFPRGWSSVKSDFLMLKWANKIDLQELVYDNGMVGIIGEIEPKYIQFRACAQVITIGKRCQLQSLRLLRAYSFDTIIVGNGFLQYSAEELWHFPQNLFVRVNGLDDILTYVRIAENKLKEVYRYEKIKNFMEKLQLQISVIHNEIWLTINHHKFSQHPLEYIRQMFLPTIYSLPHLQNIHSNLTFLELQQILSYKKQFPLENLLQFIERMLRYKENSDSSESYQFSRNDDDIFQSSINEEIQDEVFQDEIFEKITLKRVRSRSMGISAEEYEQDLQNRNEQLLQFLDP